MKIPFTHQEYMIHKTFKDLKKISDYTVFITLCKDGDNTVFYFGESEKNMDRKLKWIFKEDITEVRTNELCDTVMALYLMPNPSVELENRIKGIDGYKYKYTSLNLKTGELYSVHLKDTKGVVNSSDVVFLTLGEQK